MTSTDLMNIGAFKGKAPSAAFAAALAGQQESLADGIGSSYGVVGYKGKVWTLRYRGESYTLTRQDDGSPLAFLDCIILRSAPYKSKSYYTPGSYTEGASAGLRPLCSALDGVTPDIDVSDRQAAACAICPRNEWRVNAEGRKGRDCSDYKRLSVLILPNITKALLGAPLMEPVFLRVPAASLNDLAIFGEGMSNQGFHYSSFVTRIGFEPELAHPKFTFKALQALTDKEAPIVLPMREEAMAIRITGENEVGKPRPAITAAVKEPEPETVQTGLMEATGQETKPTPAAAAPVKPKPTAAAAVPKPAAQKGPPPKQPAAAVAVAEDNPSVMDASADMGFDLGGGAAQPSASPSVTQTAEDTGEPDEADDALNARIANILKTT